MADKIVNLKPAIMNSRKGVFWNENITIFIFVGDRIYLSNFQNNKIFDTICKKIFIQIF